MDKSGPMMRRCYIMVIDWTSYCAILCCFMCSRYTKTWICFSIFCRFFSHNLRARANGGDLSPQFNVKVSAGTIFITFFNGSVTVVLEKNLSMCLISDPIFVCFWLRPPLWYSRSPEGTSEVTSTQPFIATVVSLLWMSLVWLFIGLFMFASLSVF